MEEIHDRIERWRKSILVSFEVYDEHIEKTEHVENVENVETVEDSENEQSSEDISECGSVQEFYKEKMDDMTEFILEKVCQTIVNKLLIDKRMRDYQYTLFEDGIHITIYCGENVITIKPAGWCFIIKVNNNYITNEEQLSDEIIILEDVQYLLSFENNDLYSKRCKKMEKILISLDNVD